MLNIVPFACGKIVNSMWDVRLKSVDEYPQNSEFTYVSDTQSVYNPTFMPYLPSYFPHFYPQAFLVKLSPLMSTFSPLSTPPIIITTNLKNQER